MAGTMIKHGLPPIARADARIFILGSLPGDASLSERRYYAHPTNQFWRLLGSALGEDLQARPYAERLERLAARHIGLWDVVAFAERRGSLDQAIRAAGHNPIDRLLDDYAKLEAIAFNGAAAAAAGRKLLQDARGLTLIDLPSSSAANTRSFAEKAEIWRIVGQFCGAAGLPSASMQSL